MKPFGWACSGRGRPDLAVVTAWCKRCKRESARPQFRWLSVAGTTTLCFRFGWNPIYNIYIYIYITHLDMIYPYHLRASFFSPFSSSSAQVQRHCHRGPRLSVRALPLDAWRNGRWRRLRGSLHAGVGTKSGPFSWEPKG